MRGRHVADPRDEPVWLGFFESSRDLQPDSTYSKDRGESSETAVQVTGSIRFYRRLPSDKARRTAVFGANLKPTVTQRDNVYLRSFFDAGN